MNYAALKHKTETARRFGQLFVIKLLSVILPKISHYFDGVHNERSVVFKDVC